MNTSGPCLSFEIQAQIEPSLMPLIKPKLVEQKETNIIRVKIRRNPSQAASETYKVNISNFKDNQPE